jgi:phosphoribosylglycinamide formyltransferase-1
MLNIVVLISGSGSNLQAIIDAIATGRLKARIAGVLSNKADAYGLVRAQQAGISTAVLSHTGYASREDFDAAMALQIDAWSPDIVVLAGFMRILTPAFVRHYEGRLLNIHPSLLPRHKGMHTHRRALEEGDREHGCSVHYVTAELDGGPVVAQAVVPVLPDDDEPTLTERVHKGEHVIYPEVLVWLAEGRLTCENGHPRVDGKPLNTPVRIEVSC